MKTTLPFLNSYFWRSIYGPILAFIFPGILLAILGHIFRIEYIFPGIIALTIIVITNLLLPITLSEQKSSSVFKFIGTTKLGRGKFLFGVIIFFVILTIISLAILFGVLMIFFKDKVFPKQLGKNMQYFEVIENLKIPGTPPYDWHNILRPVIFDRGLLSGISSFDGFSKFLFSISLHFVFSLIIGLTVVSLCKNPQWTITISIIIVLLSIFLSGMVIPADIIASSKELKMISRFIPYSYTTGNIIVSSTSIQQSGIFLSSPIDFSGNPISGSAATFTSANNQVLRSMIFGKEFSIMRDSTNNIFDFTHGYAVRKMPEIDKVMDFVKRFLAGGDTDNINSHFGRFVSIWQENIVHNDYGFMDLFSVQSNKLYESWGKILNIVIPTIASLGIGLYLFKWFDWGVRR